MKNKKQLTIMLLLLVASISLNIIQYMSIIKLREEVKITNNNTNRPPEIIDIKISDINDGEIFKDNWYIVPNDGKIKMKIDIIGNCTDISFFMVPTGTEMVLEQKIVGHTHVSPGVGTIEYILDIEKGTMGHLFIVVHNFSVSRTSSTFSIYFE